MAVNGIDLIIPTSIAHTSGSASINSGGSVTFTGVTALSLNGVFSSTYDNYVIDVRGNASTAANIEFRLRAGGTDNTTSNSYVFQHIEANATSVAGARTTSNLSRIGPFNAIAACGIAIYVYGPALAQPTAHRSITANDAISARIYDIAGTHNQSVAYDGFTLFPGSGNMTGLIKVYGLVK
jgi:hypothetical protein